MQHESPFEQMNHIPVPPPEALILSETDEVKLGTTLFATLVSDITHGIPWQETIAKLELEHPDLDVKALIEKVADANWIFWKTLH